MGIKGLFAFLRKKYPNAAYEADISQFHNKKLAIDIAGFIYKYKIVNPNKWLDSFIYLICLLRKNEIYPYFIFDGKSPLEKHNEHLHRAEQKKKMENKHMKLGIAYDHYETTGEVKEILMEETKNLKLRNQALLSPFEREELCLKDTFDPNLIKNRIDKLDNQIVNIEPEEIDTLKNLINYFGYSYLSPEVGEAEAVCSYLANKGIVNGVISGDSDVLAYEVPLFLYDLDIYSGKVQVYLKENVLSEINLTSKEFTDFCIMCGTDYNDNIPKVGPANALKLILNSGNIDNIVHSNKSILNHEAVRNIFYTFQEFNQNTVLPTINPVKYIELGNLLIIKNSRVSIEYIKECWKPYNQDDIVLT